MCTLNKYIYIYIYMYTYTSLSLYIIYIYIYIYIYTRRHPPRGGVLRGARIQMCCHTHGVDLGTACMDCYCAQLC